jgi:hypothetical protein
MTSALDLASQEWPYTPRQLFEAADRLRAHGMPTKDIWMAVEVLEHVANHMLLTPLNDVLIKELIKSAAAGGTLTRQGNTSSRIVKAVERYYGVDGTEPTCPMCNKPVTAPPCSMNSDGAFHLDHPHNPGKQARLLR